MTPRCEDCRYWDNSVHDGNAQPDTTGLCRQSPPTVNGITGKTHWPFTEDTDWCARHLPTPDLDDETKF